MEEIILGIISKPDTCKYRMRLKGVSGYYGFIFEILALKSKRIASLTDKDIGTGRTLDMGHYESEAIIACMKALHSNKYMPEHFSILSPIQCIDAYRFAKEYGIDDLARYIISIIKDTLALKTDSIDVECDYLSILRNTASAVENDIFRPIILTSIYGKGMEKFKDIIMRFSDRDKIALFEMQLMYKN